MLNLAAVMHSVQAQLTEHLVISAPRKGTYSVVSGSYGQGIHFTAATGYHFNRFIGAEPGLSYLKITPIKGTIEDVPGNATIRMQMGANMFFLLPSLTLRTDHEKFNLYGRIGLLKAIIW